MRPSSSVYWETRTGERHFLKHPGPDRRLESGKNSPFRWLSKLGRANLRSPMARTKQTSPKKHSPAEERDEEEAKEPEESEEEERRRKKKKKKKKKRKYKKKDLVYDLTKETEERASGKVNS